MDDNQNNKQSEYWYFTYITNGNPGVIYQDVCKVSHPLTLLLLWSKANNASFHVYKCTFFAPITKEVFEQLYGQY